MYTLPNFSDMQFDDRYQLVERIGRGGMATVYSAVDNRLHKRVAVKVLNPHPAFSEDYEGYLARFRQEAVIAAQLKHPNLVDVTDFGTHDEMAYLVMELLDGESLGERLDRDKGPMPWREVLAIILPVCDALAAVHDRGLIHRDIKPGNIYLVAPRRPSAAPTVKLLDLGIAKILPHVAASFRDAAPDTCLTQGTPGTPEYMAPEQFETGVIDHRIDLYSLGVTLYRMLTGDLPFSAPNAQSHFQIQRMHVETPPVSMRQLRPEADIPAQIEAVVMRALAKRPDERHTNARELAEALLAAERTELGIAPPTVVPELRPPLVADDRTTTYVRAERPPVSRLLATCAVLSGFMTAGTVFMLCMLVEIPGVQAFADRLRGGASSVEQHPDAIQKFEEPEDVFVAGVPGGTREEPAAPLPEPVPYAKVVVAQAPDVETVEEPSPKLPPPEDEPPQVPRVEPPLPRPAKPGSPKVPRPAKPSKPPAASPGKSTKDVKGQAKEQVLARLRKINNCKRIIPQKVKLSIRVTLDSGRIEARDEAKTKGGTCLCDALNRQRIKAFGTGVLDFDHWTSV